MPKLKDMKKAELEQVAEGFAVDLEDAKTKAQILARLEDEGVTDEVVGSTEEGKADEAVAEPVAEKKVVKAGDPDAVIVYMRKANPTYEIFGHKFTKQHPYVAMSETDAQDIFDAEPRGFSIATPAQAKEYYS